ncbi:MAG: glycosyltransferase family 4 protein [Candidatus Omnitrophota bacterium]
MKILLLTTHLNYGGITNYLISLAKGLKKRGHHVSIASSGGEAEEVFSSYGINSINIPIHTKCEVSPKILLSLFALKKQLKNSDTDIIHAHTRVSQVLGKLLSTSLSCAYVTTCHGFFKNRFSRRIFPAWGKNVIAISKAVADNLEKDFRLEKKNITVIHNGIEYDKFISLDNQAKIDIKNSLNLPKDGPVVAMVARLSEVKGHSFFIQAIPLILEKFPKSSFLIVGEGRLKLKLLEQVAKLKIDRSVFFIPTQADTSKVLAIVDSLVCPSLQEGLGLSILEAQAAGVPVAAFAIGGIPSLIQHEKTGLLVKPFETTALAEAIIRILTDKELQNSIIKEAKDNVRRKFNIDKMVEDTLRVYSDAVSKNN